MRPAMSSLLCRTIRFSRVSPFASKQHQSLVSFSSSSSLLRKPPQNTSKPLSLFFPFRFASSAAKKVGADEKLKLVIESEIQCAVGSDDRDQGGVLPDEFPFEIIDNPGEQTIILKRKFAGESIQVEVHMPDMTGEEDELDDEDDDDEDDEDKNSGQFDISLIVTVFKGEGPHLEFYCTGCPDKITIDSISMKRSEVSSDQTAYEGPVFSDLDENLQNAFHKYLEVRGIKSSLTNLLQEYMIKKDNREYLVWLKNMKEFVEK